MVERNASCFPNAGVSVVVVCYNERGNIAACIESLCEQSVDFPFEIILVDNNSTDGTREILIKFSHSCSRLRLLHNPVRNISVSRQLGLEAARHPWVAYTDADCVVPADWLAALAAGARRHGDQGQQLAAVGGGNRPPVNDNRFYQVLDVVLNSYLFSHGSVQARRYSDDRPVDHLPTVNVLYRREALQVAGGFKPGCGNVGEDLDVSYRLRRKGYRLIYLSGAEVIHRMRSTYKSWLLNMFRYGKGRMNFLRHHPCAMRPWVLLPMGLVLVLVIAGFFCWYPFTLAMATYFLLIAFYGASLCVRKRCLNLLPSVWMLFVGTHLAYGLGQWLGLLGLNRSGDRCE